MRVEYELFAILKPLPHAARMRILERVGSLYVEMGEYHFEDVGVPTDVVREVAAS